MNERYAKLSHVALVALLIALVALMFYFKAPEAATIGATASAIIIAYLRTTAPTTTAEIVRAASLRPPPEAGETEVIEVVMPKAAPLPSKPIPREEPKE